MGREDVQLSTAKRAYKQAASIGNVQEEARWANVIGDILKNRGEYVEALKWLRIDYDVSVNHLPEKQVLPTCQSLGEVYLRLQNYEEALLYQEEHLKLAKESNDLVEQQRATTQLGRTYHEMFLKSEDDHAAVRNAKKYFKSSMNLARTLKENTSLHKSSHFLKEFIDAHNNIGMLEMDLDNLEEAEKILLEGLKICDEEEVIEDDDGRSRLNHNLGSVYMEMRMWDKAREHIEKDIRICKKIEHCQGEAKGYINLGELHYRVQKYDEALQCYQKAIRIARTMEDEDALVENINQNIKIIKEAVKVMDELKKEEQNLKKLRRTTTMAKGTPSERKHLLQQNAALDVLIEKSSIIFHWLKHLDFAKRKKKVANELCDKEKLSDSFLVIGESYQKLRKFEKAFKWYSKSWKLYKSIGNLEGQALAKINIGDVLDGDGNWTGALEAFKEGYRLAVEAHIPSIQISALDNMHYSYMIRFDNTDEARRLQLKIQELKSSKATGSQIQKLQEDCCSETDTEGNDGLSHTRSNTCESIKISESSSTRSKARKAFEDDEPLIELFRSNKNISETKLSQLAKPRNSINQAATSTENWQKSNSTQYPSVSRKRGRVVLLDDDESDEAEISRSSIQKVPIEDVVTSYEFKKNDRSTSFANDFQDETHFVASKDMLNACTSRNHEESTCSQKSGSLNRGAKDTNYAASASKIDADYISDNQRHISVKIGDKKIIVDTRSCMLGDMLSIECMKVEVACLYYLQLSEEKKSKGLLPIIRHMKCGDKALKPLEPVETLEDNLWEKRFVEVAIDGWVQKRLMKLYIDCCKKLHEAPNMKLLNKLYNLEVSILIGCQLCSYAKLLECIFYNSPSHILYNVMKSDAKLADEIVTAQCC
ncbi:Tonsoku-like protein [Thalictrum thalictroides]|uniref:Tonsoku-like protein n=1 Tax=Thalictrum thalictroides TaxID=46969 RepID=A0A7J6VNQ1_THATH|nr:Tonsoku-like protein [Thalictrum thalictroides]